MTFIVTAQPWMADGACRDQPASVFYVDKGASVAAAKAVCKGCPVKEACLTWATTGGPEGNGEHHGVWGGKTPRERRAIRTGRVIHRIRAVAHCGTASGYHRHWREREQACQPCIDAMRASARERSERRRRDEGSAA